VTTTLLGDDVGVVLMVGVIVFLGLGDTVGLVGVLGRLVIGAAADLAVQAVRTTTNTRLQSLSFILILM
jgi:hypothetical protein